MIKRGQARATLPLRSKLMLVKDVLELNFNFGRNH